MGDNKMRKVYVCKKVTPAVLAKVEALGIPEIAVQAPDAPLLFDGLVTKTPCIVIESAVRPREILAILPSNATIEDIESVSDYEVVPPPPTLEEMMAALEGRVATLEEKLITTP